MCCHLLIHTLNAYKCMGCLLRIVSYRMKYYLAECTIVFYLNMNFFNMGFFVSNNSFLLLYINICVYSAIHTFLIIKHVRFKRITFSWNQQLPTLLRVWKCSHKIWKSFDGKQIHKNITRYFFIRGNEYF